MTKGRCLPGVEATVSLFIPLFAVNDEIRRVSVKYPPPLNHNDCQDRFHSHKRHQKLRSDSLESLLSSYPLLCVFFFFWCFSTLSNEMPPSSAAHFSGILCSSVLLMQLRGLWEYGDETKRAFQISALQIKGTNEKVTIDRQTKACSFALHLLLFFFPKCMAA